MNIPQTIPKNVAIPVKAPAFKMPRVEVGMSVLWFHDPTQTEGQPALVTRVGEQTINMIVGADDVWNLKPRNGCKHADDPSLTEQHAKGSGCWRHTAFTEEAFRAVGMFSGIFEFEKAMHKRMEEVEAKLEELATRPETPAKPK